MLKQDIYTIYDAKSDMTIIFEDNYKEETREVVSTEIKGFYYGKPTEENTKQYHNKLKAIF